MSYQRKKGDFEIRILKDGRIVMIAPNEELWKTAQEMGKIVQNSKEFEEAENGTNE